MTIVGHRLSPSKSEAKSGTGRTLILIRHAHRDKNLGQSSDNGLSEKGKKQADALTQQLRHLLENEQVTLATSPKARCVETLDPLATALNIELCRDELLLEQGNHEGAGELASRVMEFLKGWKRSDERVTAICSHGDWIPIATESLTGKPIDLKKSGFVVITVKSGKPVSTTVIQDLFSPQAIQRLPS